MPLRGGVNSAANDSPGGIGGMILSPMPLKSGHAVGKALDLEPVPVHAARLVQLFFTTMRTGSPRLSSSTGPGI